MSRFSELVRYLYRARKKGLKKAEIDANLKTMGWNSLWIWLAWKKLHILSHRSTNQSSSKKTLNVYVKYSLIYLPIVFIIYLSFWTSGFIFLKGPAFFRPDIHFKELIELEKKQTHNSSFSFEYTDGSPNKKDSLKWNGEGKLSEIHTEGESELQIGINSNLNFGDNFPAKHLVKVNSQGIYLKNYISDELSSKIENRPEITEVLNKWTRISESGDRFRKPNDIVLKLLKDSKVEKFLGVENSKSGIVLLYELNISPDLFIKGPNTSFESFKGANKINLFSPSSLTLAVSPFSGEFKYIEMVGYAPSFMTVVNKIYHKKSKESTLQNDKQRLTDLQEVSNSLERFYNKYQGYPESISGKPDINNGVFSWPTAPDAESGCSEFYNTYWYTALGDKTFNIDLEKNIYSDYKVTFCLGSNIDNHQSGVSELTPKGIQSIPCDNDPYCAPSTLNLKGMLKSERFWQGIPTNSRLVIKIYPESP